MPSKSVYDRERLASILQGQYNVIRRSQAIECGLTHSALQYRLRPGGPWRKLLPGVYISVTGTVTPDQRDIAALLYAGPGSVITGPVAVRRQRLRCPGLNVIDVLVPADVHRKSTGFVQIQRTTRMPEKTYSTGPIRFTLTPRAVADAARGMARLSDVRAVVCEAIQRGNCSLEMLVEELAEGPSAGSRWYRRALGEITDGVRSPAEADLKDLIDNSDLEKPIYNARLYTADGTFIGVTDAWWQRAGVAAEVDSREYHLGADDYVYTTRRHNLIEACGVHLLHFVPSTIKTEPDEVLGWLRDAIRRGNSKPPLSIKGVPPRS
jgi:hypothetical protein